MTELFPQADLPAPAAPAGATAASRVVGIAVASNVWQTFDYLWPDALGEPSLGIRARVPFGKGNRTTTGFVTQLARTAAPQVKLKCVLEAIEPESQLDKRLWELAEWISRYYMAPLGMVLAAMVPSAVGRHALPMETIVHLLPGAVANFPKRMGLRQRQALDELLEAAKQGAQSLPLETLRMHSGVTRESLGKLEQHGLIRLEVRPRTLGALSQDGQADPFEINPAQAEALAAIEKNLGGFKVMLLHGVTGSGKTEVYLRAIRQVIAAGRQAILLVPEIALATQTLSRLASRLERVAVLHSGLTSTQRAFYYDQIRQGQAAVVIGPRSAVFAPAPKLGLIVVDEEHEGSYKQDNVPRYHARDVAIKRAQMEGIPIILGSATPSLESLYNAQRGRYERIMLPVRVRSLPMPRVQLVELRKEIPPGKVELIGRTLESALAQTLDRREQAILLMNRRGYASYVFCPSCQWMLGCDHCSRPMIYHQALALAMCHYCQATSGIPAKCPACDGKLLLFGLGIQRIEGELARKFPNAVCARMDSDTMTSPEQFQKVLGGFAAGEIDILLGTQMVAKGLDFPKVTLVGIASADTALAIPDFRSAERTFQLIVQVAGRAGRSDRPGLVIVQTWHPEDFSIQCALRHDYETFAAQELPLRESAGVPPFVRLVRFVIRHTSIEKAQQGAAVLAGHLRKTLGREVRILGPMQAGIFKIRNLFRFEVSCFCNSPGVIQGRIWDEMPRLSQEIGAEVIADADPVSLM